SSDGGPGPASVRAAVRRLGKCDVRRDPGRSVGGRLRLDAVAEGPRAGVPGLPEARGVHRAGSRRLGTRGLLHDLGHAGPARGVPRARLYVRADARGRRRHPPGADSDDGEGVLMADEPRQRPARPLFGYRDTGEGVRHSRGAEIRAWVILGVIAIIYLAWTLTVFFLEPGLR